MPEQPEPTPTDLPGFGAVVGVTATAYATHPAGADVPAVAAQADVSASTEE